MTAKCLELDIFLDYKKIVKNMAYKKIYSIQKGDNNSAKFTGSGADSEESVSNIICSLGIC